MKNDYWHQTFPQFTVLVEPIIRAGIPGGHIRYLKKFEYSITSFARVVTGGWIVQDCKEPGCAKQVIYWSLSGERVVKYYTAKCEEHR